MIQRGVLDLVYPLRFLLLFTLAKRIRQPAAGYIDSTKRQRRASDRASDSQFVSEFLLAFSASYESDMFSIT